MTSKEEKYDEWRRYFFEVDKEMYGYFIQDLECLEELKQRWGKEEWCKGIPLSADSLKSLFDYNEELFENNLKLDKENQELKDKVNHYKNKFYTTHKSAEVIKETIRVFINALVPKTLLMLEDETTLKAVFNKVLQDLERLEELEKENEKLKNAIVILKDLLNLNLCIGEYMPNSDRVPLLCTKNNDYILNDDEYELLKEVL